MIELELLFNSDKRKKYALTHSCKNLKGQYVLNLSAVEIGDELPYSITIIADAKDMTLCDYIEKQT